MQPALKKMKDQPMVTNLVPLNTTTQATAEAQLQEKPTQGGAATAQPEETAAAKAGQGEGVVAAKVEGKPKVNASQVLGLGNGGGKAAAVVAALKEAAVGSQTDVAQNLTETFVEAAKAEAGATPTLTPSGLHLLVTRSLCNSHVKWFYGFSEWPPMSLLTDNVVLVVTQSCCPTCFSNLGYQCYALCHLKYTFLDTTRLYFITYS